LDLSIIVVSYNTQRLVEDCLRSVERHLEGKLDYELIVVDNDSKDGTQDWLREFASARPRIIPIYSAQNLGFSGGNNAGLDLAKGRHILYLNSDAYLVDDSVLGMISHLDAHPDVGLGAALLLTGDGKSGPSYGHFPTAGTLAREFLGSGFTRLRAVCPDPGWDDREVDFPCGAFFLIKGDLARELKGMDTAFFMYYEETDLAKRARDKGFKCIYFGKARAVHLGGQSSSEVKSLSLTRMFYTNWKRYLKKHHGARSAALVRWMLSGYYTLACTAHRLKGNPDVVRYYRSHIQALSEGWAAPLDAGKA
jgi:GT2 family glycosyltransferase